MAQMYLIITIRKPIDDAPEGQAIYDVIKERLADKPNLVITGQVSNHCVDSEGN